MLCFLHKTKFLSCNIKNYKLKLSKVKVEWQAFCTNKHSSWSKRYQHAENDKTETHGFAGGYTWCLASTEWALQTCVALHNERKPFVVGFENNDSVQDSEIAYHVWRYTQLISSAWISLWYLVIWLMNHAEHLETVRPVSNFTPGFHSSKYQFAYI